MKERKLKINNEKNLDDEEEILLKEIQEAYRDLENNRKNIQFRKIKHIVEQKLMLNKLSDKEKE